MWAELSSLVTDTGDEAFVLAAASLAVSFSALAAVVWLLRGCRSRRFTRDPALARVLDAVIPRYALAVIVGLGLPSIPMNLSLTADMPEATVTLTRAKAALADGVTRSRFVQGPPQPYSEYLPSVSRWNVGRLMALGVFQARRFESPKLAFQAEPEVTARRLQLFSIAAVFLALLPMNACVLLLFALAAASVERAYRRALARRLTRALPPVERGTLYPSRSAWHRFRRRGIWQSGNGERRGIRLPLSRMPAIPAEGSLVDIPDDDLPAWLRWAHRAARRKDPESGRVFLPDAIARETKAFQEGPGLLRDTP